jgi:hypothetical protein
MAKKIFDTANVLYLYEKYGTFRGVAMRTGYSTITIKNILLENGVELKKYTPARWNIKQNYK